ncbi:hypothetical protein PMI02_01499 [Novosphingobium sp. AP12]|nr:hypothetical protein PMI02_01499 [Novosphingobium sp. AP12]
MSPFLLTGPAGAIRLDGAMLRNAAKPGSQTAPVSTAGPRNQPRRRRSRRSRAHPAGVREPQHQRSRLPARSDPPGSGPSAETRQRKAPLRRNPPLSSHPASCQAASCQLASCRARSFEQLSLVTGGRTRRDDSHALVAARHHNHRDKAVDPANDSPGPAPRSPDQRRREVSLANPSEIHVVLVDIGKPALLVPKDFHGRRELPPKRVRTR